MNLFGGVIKYLLLIKLMNPYKPPDENPRDRKYKEPLVQWDAAVLVFCIVVIFCLLNVFLGIYLF